jgi:hypothetical protein
MRLRTPLDPTKTFLDDPLRMLRVLRFFSRYPNAQIDQNVLQAMANPQVLDSYKKKVAPERAGPELVKMFSGAKPAEAIRKLFETGLFSAAFNVPEMQNLNPLTMDQRNRHHKFNLLEHTLKVVEHLNNLMRQNNVPVDDRWRMNMAAVFHDIGKAHPEIGKPKPNDPEEYGYSGHEDMSAVIADSAMKSIGIGSGDRDFINMVVKQHMRPHSHMNEGEWTPKSIGRFLKDTVIPRQDRDDLWQLIIMHSEADSMAKADEPDQEDLAAKSRLRQQITDYRNRPVPIKMQPLVDGNAIQSMFPTISPKPGKGQVSFIKYIQNKLMDAQLAGEVVDPQQATSFVESLRPEVENMYRQSSWYGRAKTADFAPNPFESAPDPSKEEGVKKMLYREEGKPSLFSKNDKVRRKGPGLAFPQIEGEIVDKKGNEIKVRWSDGKEEVFDLSVEAPSMLLRV